MISRRKEPEGKPFMRVPLDRPPVKKPMPKKAKKPVESQPAGDPMKAIDRANRSQAMEAKEMKMMKKPMKKYAKGGSSCGTKKMAKGGMVSKRADGKATRGKTKCKMV
jgi:hypothetical protein